MDWVVILIIVAITFFAAWSGAREVILYRRYLRGETQYLVSKSRKNRRLLISSLLILEATLLLLGFFVLHFEKPSTALLFWVPPLLLIVAIVYLSMLDFRETTRDIDRIFKEASNSILKKFTADKRP